jgi:ribonuclease HII
LEGFLFLESEYNYKYIIGVDEVGRGPLAGPVVACSFSYKGTKANLKKDMESLLGLGVTDSKKLTPNKRKKILDVLKVTKPIAKKQIAINTLRGKCSYFISVGSEKRIDKINILQASLECMEKSVLAMDCPEEANIWVDGNKVPKKLETLSCEAIVKGDSKSFCIAMASIIAKEYRDRLMKNYSLKYPYYYFEKNAGYPTKAHKNALIKYGATKIHRKTFKGVKELL